LQRENPMNRKNVLIVTLVVVSLLMLATAVFAQINPANSFFGAWDDGTGGWTQGNAAMEIPGVDGVEPFGARLDFNNTPVADACGPDTSTIWAGALRLAHDYEDDAPAGALAFGDTSDWMIVSCDAVNPNNTTNDVRIPTGDDIIASCAVGDGLPPYAGCEVDINHWNEVVACGTGPDSCNVASEIQTIVYGNMDADCNGLIDRNEDADPNNDIPVGGNGYPNDLCFYWQAEKPPADTAWSGPLQSSIEGLEGGESTVNFTLVPTAISLVNFAASDSPIGPSMGMVILMPLGLLGLAAAFLLWRRMALG